LAINEKQLISAIAALYFSYLYGEALYRRTQAKVSLSPLKDSSSKFVLLKMKD